MATVVTISVLAVTGCSAPQPRFVAGVPPTSAGPATPGPEFSLTVTPSPKSTNVPVSVEIGTAVTGGTVTAVTLREVGGRPVPGEARTDGSAWVPERPLKHNRRYEASVTAVDAAGRAETRTTSFATMKRPTKETGTGLYLFDGTTYGVAMPVVVEFHPGVRKQDRAGVQRRMFVHTDPPQPGTWHWVGNGSQAYYRAPEFWRPGTTLSVRIAVGGHPTGDGRYGDQDRSATAKIGRRLEMKVDNATKQLTVVQDGKVVRRMPVSLGKKSTPSSSGTMVVMDKKQTTVFDTTDDAGPGQDRYRMNISFAQRLTWGGEFMHAAGWSVGDQGRRNVSHGCVNLAPGNARWLFARTLVGDPVTVRGTERALAPGNGWTAWDLSWDEFVKGSALPVPDELTAGGA